MFLQFQRVQALFKLGPKLCWYIFIRPCMKYPHFFLALSTNLGSILCFYNLYWHLIIVNRCRLSLTEVSISECCRLVLNLASTNRSRTPRTKLCNTDVSTLLYPQWQQLDVWIGDFQMLSKLVMEHLFMSKVIILIEAWLKLLSDVLVNTAYLRFMGNWIPSVRQWLCVCINYVGMQTHCI